MRRRLLVRLLVLSGAAFSLFVAVNAASVMLVGDRASNQSIPGSSTSTQQTTSGDSTAPAIASDQQAGHLANRNSSQLSEPATVPPAGPSIFEQQVHQNQHSQQISVGPSTFEQQARSHLPPSPAPISPITRGPGH